MSATKKQVDAAFLICLVLSTLGPGGAYRMDRGGLSGRHVGNANSTIDEKWWRMSCPRGLGINKTTKMCTYPDKSGQTSDIFDAFSKTKLLFSHSAGGTYMIHLQFMSELAAAFTNKRAQYHVGASLAKVEMNRSATFNATYADFVSSQTAHEHPAFEELEHNLKPGFFVLEHALEHLLVEKLEVGFHALAHAADHGVVLGETLLAEAFGLELAEVALAASGVAEFVLHWVFPVLLPIQTFMLIWGVGKRFKARGDHSRNFTSHLVLKSQCLVDQIKQERVRDDYGKWKVQPIVEEVCGEMMQTDLKKQIRATSLAKMQLYETLASLGKCLYPKGRRAWSKINCVETMYFDLLQENGQSGILYGALAFLAYYGFRLDELEGDNLYATWYEREFGIKQVANETVSLMPKLIAARDSPIGQKWLVCNQILATHRAFERTFQRLNSAIQVWMRSFARDKVGPSIRSSWWPCQKVFYKIWDESQPGFCKRFDSETGDGKEGEEPIDKDSACKLAEGFKGSLWPETEEHEEDHKEDHEEDHEDDHEEDHEAHA